MQFNLGARPRSNQSSLVGLTLTASQACNPLNTNKQSLVLLPSGSLMRTQFQQYSASFILVRDTVRKDAVPKDKPSAKTVRTNKTKLTLPWASAPPEAY